MYKSFLLLFCLSAFISCSYIGGQEIEGDGNTVVQSRNVGSFTGIVSHGSFDVEVSNAPAQSVKIEADQNLQQYIETTIENGTLHVRTRDGFNLETNGPLKVIVAAPEFSMISTHGSGSVVSTNRINGNGTLKFETNGSGDIKAEADAPEIQSEISGSGSMELSGNTKIFRGEVNGSGDIRAMSMQSEEATIEIQGSGNAEVFASVRLNIKVRGSGDIRYKGGAQVSSEIAGSGSVVKVD
jgi:hypothetical protein